MTHPTKQQQCPACKGVGEIGIPGAMCRTCSGTGQMPEWLTRLKSARDEAPFTSNQRIYEDGELWSFIRRCMAQGKDIHLDHVERTYEEYSQRLDLAALERVPELQSYIVRAVAAERSAHETSGWHGIEKLAQQRNDALSELERYKKALQTANGFLIMNNLEPVKLEYAQETSTNATTAAATSPGRALEEVTGPYTADNGHSNSVAADSTDQAPCQCGHWKQSHYIGSTKIAGPCIICSCMAFREKAARDPET